MIGCNKIQQYLHHLINNGWYVSQHQYTIDKDELYLLLTRRSWVRDYEYTEWQYELHLKLIKTKKGYIYKLNDEFYSTEDEIIEELKRIGVK
jgi:hypothetical protein